MALPVYDPLLWESRLFNLFIKGKMMFREDTTFLGHFSSFLFFFSLFNLISEQKLSVHIVITYAFNYILRYIISIIAIHKINVYLFAIILRGIYRACIQPTVQWHYNWLTQQEVCKCDSTGCLLRIIWAMVILFLSSICTHFSNTH